MSECDRAGYANPASQHAFGRVARQALEDARDRIACLLGADLTHANASRLIFTSGGTESNNLALLGLAGDPPGNLVVSAIEHPSVMRAAEYLATRGFEVRHARVDRLGVLDMDHFAALLDDDTRLASVMLANNETGVIQPVKQAAEICARREIPFHTDAVQVVGKLPVDFTSLGVSALSFAAHKFHGPRGIGGLLLRPDVEIRPILFGGFQQLGLRPGTESVSLAVGLCRALELWHDEADDRRLRMTALRDRLESTILAGISDAVVVGRDAERVPHTSNMAFPGLDRQAILMALDMAGVACSTGSACASGSSEPSPTLLAMGCEKSIVEGSIRISLGALTTVIEIDESARRILRVIKTLRKAK